MGLAGRPPADLVALIAVLFGTFSLQFFDRTAVLPGMLRLTPLVWQRGLAWQLGSYAFVGFGGPNLWFLLELLVLYWFAADVFRTLGRRRFWTVVLGAVVGAALVAALAQFAVDAVGAPGTLAPFQLMQGQRVLLVIAIAAFALLYGDATVYLFFVLPLRARWFLWIGILLGFLGYLSSKDVAGFVGICAATAITWMALAKGGRGRVLRRLRLKVEEAWLERKLRRLRRRRGFRVVDRDDAPKGPLIN